MSPTIKTLAGWVLVVLAVGWLLDWQDALQPLRQETANTARLQQREQAPASAIDWVALEKTASHAHAAWLDQLVEVPTTGVFRAIAMERMAELCQSLDIPCQVGATGEKVLELKGLVSATVRVALPLNHPRLHDLLAAIEAGPPLRSIDRLTARSGQVEMHVQTYGILSADLQQARGLGTTGSPTPGNGAQP